LTTNPAQPYDLVQEKMIMPTFVIDEDKNITAYADNETVPEGGRQFNSLDGLAQICASASKQDLADLWNTIPGVEKVRTFTRPRVDGISRIWQALQRLVPGAHTPQDESQPELAGKDEEVPKKREQAGKRQKQMVSKKKRTQKRQKPVTGLLRDGSKGQKVIELLKREGGATVGQIAKATGWQNHSIRGFISGTLGKKLGLKIHSEKGEGKKRFYSLVS
jgi:hypothetical protein